MKGFLNSSVAALLTALVVAGCSAGASTGRDIQISSHDRPRWIRPEDVARYQCSDGGILFCDGAIGRTTERLCRCLPP
jgi:predicted small secreted protein